MSERWQAMIPFTRECWVNIGQAQADEHVRTVAALVGVDPSTVEITYHELPSRIDPVTLYERPAEVIAHAAGRMRDSA